MQRYDAKDLRILRVLQVDSTAAVADLAAQIGLSINACWRRVKRLQDETIDRQVAILQPEQFGFGLTAFVSVRTNEHNDQWLQTFLNSTSAFGRKHTGHHEHALLASARRRLRFHLISPLSRFFCLVSSSFLEILFNSI